MIADYQQSEASMNNINYQIEEGAATQHINNQPTVKSKTEVLPEESTSRKRHFLVGEEVGFPNYAGEPTSMGKKPL